VLGLNLDLLSVGVFGAMQGMPQLAEAQFFLRAAPCRRCSLPRGLVPVENNKARIPIQQDVCFFHLFSVAFICSWCHASAPRFDNGPTLTRLSTPVQRRELQEQENKHLDRTAATIMIIIIIIVVVVIMTTTTTTTTTNTWPFVIGNSAM
jgi:hypothetical protein